MKLGACKRLGRAAANVIAAGDGDCNGININNIPSPLTLAMNNHSGWIVGIVRREHDDMMLN